MVAFLRYGVKSHILFVNKLDRMGASLRRSMLSFMQKGLHSRPLLVQLPVYQESGNDTTFTGLIDLIRLETLTFTGSGGENVRREPLTSSRPLYEESLRARKALIESLAAVDETLLESVLEGDALENDQNDTSLVSETQLKDALRRQTIEGTVIPVFCSSAARNIGIQSLLDGIYDFLPSPRERPFIPRPLHRIRIQTKVKRAGKGKEL
jgi:elongation factor G